MLSLLLFLLFLKERDLQIVYEFTSSPRIHLFENSVWNVFKIEIVRDHKSDSTQRRNKFTKVCVQSPCIVWFPSKRLTKIQKWMNTLLAFSLFGWVVVYPILLLVIYIWIATCLMLWHQHLFSQLLGGLEKSCCTWRTALVYCWWESDFRKNLERIDSWTHFSYQMIGTIDLTLENNGGKNYFFDRKSKRTLVSS